MQYQVDIVIVMFKKRMTSAESSSHAGGVMCSTILLFEVLGSCVMLTTQQKNCIEGTPFGWFMLLSDNVKISRRVLKELCTRWVEKKGWFFY